MYAVVKSKLKSARDSIAKKDYGAARDAALKVLEYEPENYNANVFLGLAQLELGNLSESEQAYRKAIDSNMDQPLAWQGLSKFYECQADWNKYVDTLQQLARLHSTKHDAVKCAEAVQKILDVRREHGDREQMAGALSMLLPDSTLFPVLSSLPPPDPTNPTPAASCAFVQASVHNTLPIYEEIAFTIEKDEDAAFRREFDKRRTRLGAGPPEQLKREVGVEIWAKSRLPDLYNEILNHPNTPDDLRRAVDAKLLRYKHRYLEALPVSSPEKSAVADEVDNLVDGAVVLGIPDELAWTLFLESRDYDTIEGYDYQSLRQFVSLFPQLPLASLVRAYLMLTGISVTDGSDDEEGQGEQSGTADVPGHLDIIMDSFAMLSGSILAHRIVSVLHEDDMDYQNAVKVAGNGLELVRRSESSWGRKLIQVRKAFNVTLAMSLVHLFPPKHHARAMGIIEEVFAVDPHNIPCLMGRAYILQHAGKWKDASTLFSRVIGLIDDHESPIRLRAEEEHAWCQFKSGNLDEGLSGLKGVEEELETQESRDDEKARCLWRIGSCLSVMAGPSQNEAYRSFIAALKVNPGYAPAFTSLGIHYLEHASPPDPTRASKCFQKAFELDAREADAARRLAIGFADEREWDLVEIVARRTIEGEGGLNAGLDAGAAAAKMRYLSTNAWAWKAVGVVELNRHNYPSAIEAFQISLRTEPDDHLSWLRLGETYSKAGRHAAAIKALARAKELRPDDWICSYFIAEVHRQVGQYDEATKLFAHILEQHPHEVGVLMSLAATHIEQGLDEAASGFVARSEESFLSCVQVALLAMRHSPGYRGVLWKPVADALYYLARRSSFIDPPAVCSVLETVAELPSFQKTSPRTSGALPEDIALHVHSLHGLDALAICVAAYDTRISLISQEGPATASAWYDLGASLYTWTQTTLSPDSREKAMTQSVDCFIKALREDPGNDQFWDALAVAHFVAKPQLAQHAFLKALEINSKSVATWTNLGLLYFQHDDVELANEAFLKAQTLDPDYAAAWIGQGLLASKNGHEHDAKVVLEYAVSLTASVPEGDLLFSRTAFAGLNMNNHRDGMDKESFFPLFFALDRYCKQRPDDASALHLLGLVCERLGKSDTAMQHIQKAISILETVYEENEDATVERQYTVANSNLARLHLAAHDNEAALDGFQSALGLLPEETADTETRVLRVQGYFGSALAKVALHDLEGAISLFESAKEAAGDDAALRGHVSVLLAQTLWSLGTDEFREAAKSELLESIDVDPENLEAINTLAGMGITTHDSDLVDAALSELLALPLDRRNVLDPRRDVAYLLRSHHVAQGNADQALAVAQKAVFAEPRRTGARCDLATLSLQEQQENTARAILDGSIAARSEVPLDVARQAAGLLAVLTSLGGENTAIRRAQRAVMLAPWDSSLWRTLAYVRTRAAT